MYYQYLEKSGRHQYVERSAIRTQREETAISTWREMAAVRVEPAIALTVMVSAVGSHPRRHGLGLDLEGGAVAGGRGQVGQSRPPAPLVKRQAEVGKVPALEGVEAGAVVESGNSILHWREREHIR